VRRPIERLELSLVGFIGAGLIFAAGAGIVYLGLWLILRIAFDGGHGLQDEPALRPD
jgi:hypothetical protein